MMHIAFCLDNKYVPYCATTIASIIDNNKGEEIIFHLFVDSVTETNKTTLCTWINSFCAKRIEFYELKESEFGNFPVGDAYINLTTYFRLVIQDRLPHLDKILYMDCDTIVNNSLIDLWNTDLENYAVAGVRDRINDNIRLYNRLQYPITDGYVNAGVLIINLKKWREFHIFERAENLATQMPGALKNHDQDIINKIYHGQILMLPFKYNLLEYYMYTEEWLYLDRKYYPEIIEACKNPVIIHFCMPVKPWHYECVNPYRDLYYKYRKMTPWPEIQLTHKFVNRSKKEKLKLFLEKIGLYHVERKSTLRKNIDVIEEPDNVLY